MLGVSDITNAAEKMLLSQVRVTPTGLTAAEVMVDPSNLHGHQGNNDVYILNRSGSNFQLFRSHDDITFIHGTGQMASFWGCANMSVYDDGIGTILRFSELAGHSVNVYGFGNDATARVVLYNPTANDLWCRPDGHGGTMLGSIDFIGACLAPNRISVVHTPTAPSLGGLI
ncbi:MAG TPA: hypothetical protein VHO91_17825 [Rhodopila sp.]|nr:hypothetical protein [Rhodopila sp.]